MNLPAPAVRQGEYAARGDYHRAPDRDVGLSPHVPGQASRSSAPISSGCRLRRRVLDAGCGEGVLVEEFAGRLAIEGIDANYSSPHVRQGSLLALP